MGDEQLRLCRNSLPDTISEELSGQGVSDGLLRHPLAASGLALLLCTPPSLRAGWDAAYPFGDGAGHAGRDGVDALGYVLALRSYGAGLQGLEALPRQR